MILLHLILQGAITEYLLCAKHRPDSCTCTLLLILMVTFEIGNYFQSSHFTDIKTKALESNDTFPEWSQASDPGVRFQSLYTYAELPLFLLLSQITVIICLHIPPSHHP